MDSQKEEVDRVLSARAGGLNGALLVLPHEEALEIAQETALQFIVHSEGHEITHPFSWGRTTGYRLALRYTVWDETRRKLAQHRTDPTLLSVGAPSPEDARACGHTMRVAEACCTDDLDRQILWEHLLGTSTQAELAAAWEVTRACIAQRVVRLRRRMRRTIAAALVEPK